MSDIARKLLGISRTSTASAVSYTYNGLVFSDANLATYTFLSAPLGTATTDRLIVLPVFALVDSSRGSTDPIVTVGGVLATKLVGPIIDSISGRTYLYMANVPSGTTGNIVVQVPISIARCYIPIYSVYGAGPTPLDLKTTFVESTVVNSLSLAVDTSVNGAVIAFSEFIVTGSPPTNWTNITEDMDVVAEAGSSRRVSSASTLTSSTGTLTVTAAFSGTTTQGMEFGAVSFAPL